MSTTALTALWFWVDAATGETLDLTPERPGVSQPRWSPSGREIGFVDRGAGEAPQVYVLPMGGGEARQVTRAEKGVSLFHWSVDGERILFTTREAVPAPEGEERHNKSFEVGTNSFLTLEAPTSLHLWSAPAEGGEARRITEGEWSITDFVPAPDGRTAALQTTPAPHTGGIDQDHHRRRRPVERIRA